MQILLLPQARSEASRARLVSILSGLGIQVVGQGQASVSVRLAPELFELVFGSPPRADAQQLPVPTPLSPFVQSITLAPPHLAFGGSRGHEPKPGGGA
ncbi:MAG: hypothetical protein ABI895_11985 [Deltaproteobacteria bacterium]